MNGITKVKIALCAGVPLLLGATLSGDDPTSPYTRLSLTGTGYSSQASEYVAVSAAALTFSTSASQAMRANATDIARLRDRLSRLGVAHDDFRTANFTFRKSSDPDDHDGDRAEGFVVQHQLAIVIRKPDSTGAVMDALIEAGAKDLSMNQYWGYSQEISPQVVKEARAGAIRDAQEKAADYARAMGMRIRRVVSINDQGGYSRNEPRPAARMIAADSATSIETRPATVLASVGMVFDLDK